MPATLSPPLKLLERLCNVVAVSGDEGEVRKIVLEEIKDRADEVRVDALGNVLATRRGRGAKRLRVMLDAHMDEVGLMIVADEGEGVYRFETVGGIDSRHLIGKQFLVGKERTPAVIGGKPIHLMEAGERTRKVGADALRLDLGLAGKARVGERAGFATTFRRVGPSIMAKSIDNRIGVATLIELVKHAPPNIDLCAAFTVQEEIGLRGAKVAAQFFDPALAITVDSTPANDLPDYAGNENTLYNTKLGLGAAIYVADGSTLHDPRLVRFFQEVAKAEGILHQLRQPGGGGTNSAAIQRALAGIPAVSVSVPHRYTHSPVSLARVDDWRHTLNLLQAALKKISRDLVSKR